MICRIILFCFALLAAGPCIAADSFRDCSDCPDMVVIPAGTFRMGASSQEPWSDNAGPRHDVTLTKAFAVGLYEVTFDQWEACVNDDNGCGGYAAASDGWGRRDRPVIYVNWHDAQNYVRWLNKKVRGSKAVPENAADSGPYRLLTEAEWEYAARAGTTTRYYWGVERKPKQANCDGCGSQWDNKQTAPVGSFPPNPFGLYDMAGNVLQWVQDCAHRNYVGAPTDGAAWETGPCDARVMRGGSWFNSPYYLRSAQRYLVTPDFRANNAGFRVAKTLD